MSKIQILQKLVNTKLDGQQTKEKIGKLIRNAFDQTTEPEEAMDLLAIGWKYQIPQIDEMMNDFDVEFNL